MESVLAILPVTLRNLIRSLPDDVLTHLEEIRIRENRPLEILFQGGYGFVTVHGKIANHSDQAFKPSRDDCLKLLDLLTNHSLYTQEEQLKQGFITIRGGHRVGLAGRAVLEQGKVRMIKDIGSFNIRIAREVLDAGKQILPLLLDQEQGTVHHTLIISSPQQGKTTLIRDLARLLSYGGWTSGTHPCKALKVGIVDERSELAACVKGIPHFDVGPRTDVLDGCPKAEGLMMMIRSMSPEVIVVDEIGRSEDALAIREALHAGIRVMATAHGSGLDDIRDRPVLKELLDGGMFNRYVLLSRKQGSTTDFAVYDRNGVRLDRAGYVRTLANRGLKCGN